MGHIMSRLLSCPTPKVMPARKSWLLQCLVDRRMFFIFTFAEAMEEPGNQSGPTEACIPTVSGISLQSGSSRAEMAGASLAGELLTRSRNVPHVSTCNRHVYE